MYFCPDLIQNMEKLKQRWGITSNLQVILILIVFSINGSFAAYITKPALAFFGIYRDEMSGFIYWPIRILLVFAIYQTTLPIVGACFGQFKFFWNFTKKMLSRMGMKSLFKEEEEKEKA